MERDKATYDVFLAYDRHDTAVATQVAESLRSQQLRVFDKTHGVAVGAQAEELQWEAMAESHALVVIFPPDGLPAWLTFEIGAAQAWNKPIYGVLPAGTTGVHFSAPVRSINLLPISRIDEIARAIANTAKPLSETEIATLGTAYLSTGLTTDQLLIRPQELARFVSLFNRKSGRNLSGEQVMSHLLRLRKQGLLPTLARRRVRKRRGDSEPA
jgi:hypothetical protein